MIPFCDRSIGLRQTIYVHRMQVQVRHLLKEMRSWRTRSYCDSNGVRETHGFLRSTQKGVHSRSRVVMGDVFFFEQSPDLGIVNLP